MTTRPTITYAAGCKFCRWVARTILKYFDVDIIPSRDADADSLFQADKRWTFEERIGHWHFTGDNGYTYHDPVAAILMVQAHGFIPRWISHSRLVKLDQWVKLNRPLLSHFVPDGPAYKRIGNKWWWMIEHKWVPWSALIVVEPIEGFPKEGLDVK